MKTTYENNRQGILNALQFLDSAIATEQKRLDAAASLNAEELVTAYAQTRDFHELLDENRKKLYHIMNSYKESVIPTRMLEQGLKTISTDDYRVTRSNRFTASMLDKEACFEWLRKNGLGDIITETVNAQTLGKVAEGLIKENKDLPEALFKTGTSATISLTAIK